MHDTILRVDISHLYINVKKIGQSAPGPFKKSNHSSLWISATVHAFRGHGFSLQLMHFPQTSPPALQSTNIDGNNDYRVGSISSLTENHSCLSNKQLIDFLATHFMDCSGRRRLQQDKRDR